MQKIPNLFFASLVAAALFGTALSIRFLQLDAVADAQRNLGLSPDVISSPGPGPLNILALQHSTAISDFVWLQIVQNLGEHEARLPAVADRVERWSEIASDLDPKYFAVQYYPAVVMSVFADRVESSDRLAIKGQENLPERWEFPFLLGYNAYFVHVDPARASKHWLRCAEMPGVPQYIASLVARSTLQAGDPQQAIALLEEMLQWMPEGAHRQDAEDRLKIIKTELYIFSEYDAACAAFRTEVGRMPTPGELFHGGRVRNGPLDLFGKEIYFDSNCRARTEVIHVREDEERARIRTLKKKNEGEGDGPSIQVIDNEQHD